MPWCAVLSKYGWRLPDDFVYNESDNHRLRAVYAMAGAMTVSVSSIINEIDNLRGDDRLKATQVAVPFGNMHSASLNVPPVCLFVFPGVGTAETREAQRVRRAQIHSAVMRSLMAQRQTFDPYGGYEWPSFLIEVILVSMTGSESPGSWVPQHVWGGADLDQLVSLANRCGLIA